MEVKVLQLEEKANQPPVRITNKCFDHEFENDNNSERKRVRDKRREQHEYMWCVHMCRNIIINSYLTSATVLPLQ